MSDEVFNPYEQAWFDRMQINNREAGPGQVGIHIFKAGESCRYFAVPIELMRSPGLFVALMDMVKAAWKTPDPYKHPCPRCGQDMRLHRRRYDGQEFCGFCGIHYDDLKIGKI